MPSPQVVPVSDAPERIMPTKPKSEGLRILISQVEEMLPRILELRDHPESSVLFHLTDEDSPDFNTTGVRLAQIKDRYRRMFRKALDTFDIDTNVGGEFMVRYEFFWTRKPKGDIEASGFRAFVMLREGNE